MAGYVEDGFDRQGYIEAAAVGDNGDRIYDSLSFVYRTATRRELVTVDAKIKVALADELSDATCRLKAEDITCEFIKSKLISWDLKTGSGRPVPVAVDALYRIHPLMFGILYNIVRGWRTSDLKPKEETPPMSDEEQLKNSSGV